MRSRLPSRQPIQVSKTKVVLAILKGALPPFAIVGPMDLRYAAITGVIGAVTAVDALYTDPRHQDERVDAGIPIE